MNIEAKILSVVPQKVDPIPMVEVKVECTGAEVGGAGRLMDDSVVLTVEDGAVEKAEVDCAAVEWTCEVRDLLGEVLEIPHLRCLRVRLAADGDGKERGVKAVLHLAWPWQGAELVYCAARVGARVSVSMERRQMILPGVGEDTLEDRAAMVRATDAALVEKRLPDGRKPKTRA